MARGNIILLNGTSSSGKSTIAKALQEIMDGYYLHTGIDHYLERVPGKMHVASDGKNPSAAEGFLWVFPDQDQFVTEIRLGPAGYRILSGMYHAVATLAVTGNNIILTDVIFDRRVLQKAVNTLYRFDPLFVGVRCPLDTAQQRERERGDRTQGLVKAHYDIVHAHGTYDFEVDTSTLTAAECADLIKNRLLKGPRPDALRKLRRRIGTSQNE